MKKIAILQSNYLPWKGVFEIINSVDTFVFLEDVQYTERDWRNRNRICTAHGVKWITVPVKSGKGRGQLIYEAEIDNNVNWRKQHFNAFQCNYSRAPYYKQYKWILEEIFMDKEWSSISELNMYSTKLISTVLGIKTEFVNSRDLTVGGKKDDKLIGICKSLKGNYYLSGPAAKDYIIPEKFESNGIALEYLNYSYPEYHQIFSPFDHYVTIMDLIFNCGPEAPYYIWGWKVESKHDKE